jgi:hypothetical protein
MPLPSGTSSLVSVTSMRARTAMPHPHHGELRASNLQRCCHFNTPHSLQLWSVALRYDNWGSITTYWARRGQIADCQGATAPTADVGTNWYRPTYRDIDGFGICAACHEALVCSHPIHLSVYACHLCRYYMNIVPVSNFALYFV